MGQSQFGNIQIIAQAKFQDRMDITFILEGLGVIENYPTVMKYDLTIFIPDIPGI